MEGTWEVHGRCVEGVQEVDNSQNFKCASLFVLGYHWLP